jgi:ribosomal protein L24
MPAATSALARRRERLASCCFAQGTLGKLLKVDLKRKEVIVEGVNIKTKHVKPMKEGESGSLVKKECPIHISNVKISDEQPAAAEEPAAEAA